MVDADLLVAAVLLVAAALGVGGVLGADAPCGPEGPGADADAPRRLDADWSRVGAQGGCGNVILNVAEEYVECSPAGAARAAGYAISVRHPNIRTPYEQRLTKFTCPRGLALADAPLQDGFLDVVPGLEVVGCGLADAPIACQLKVSRPGAVEEVSLRGAALAAVRAEPALLAVLLAGLRGLRRLELDGGDLAALPDGVLDGLPALRELSLPNNSLRADSVDALLGLAAQLHGLNLIANKLAALPPALLKGMPNLTHLDLGRNELAVLPEAAFARLPSLAVLALNDNKLTALPEGVFHALPALRKLNLGGNTLKTLPDGVFTRNIMLEAVWLDDNDAEGLHLPPAVLANLPKLTKVVLRSSNLVGIPRDSFWGSPGLQELDLSDNQLRELPPDLLRDCAKLQKLVLAFNEITSIHDNTFQTCESLETLNLSNNYISNLTRQGLAGLGGLVSFEARGNLLTHLGSLAGSPRLQSVDLHHNQLALCERRGEESPVAGCAALATLRLSDNRMTQICDDWARLPRLRLLNLTNNAVGPLRWAAQPGGAHDDLVVLADNNRVSLVDLDALGNAAAVRWRLRGNPLQCACSMLPFLRRLREQPTGVAHSFEADGAECAGPAGLAGRPLSGVQLADVDCSVPCVGPCRCHEMPAEAVAEATAAALVVDCSDRDLDEAPAWPAALGPLGAPSKGATLSVRGVAAGRVFNLSLSGNRLRRLKSLPHRLTVLGLDRNEMTHIPDDMVRSMAVENFTMTLGGNPWECDCSLQPLVEFLKDNPWRVLDEPHCTNGQSLLHLKDKLCVNALQVALPVPLAALCMLAIASALYYRFRFSIKAWLYAHSLCLSCVLEKHDDNLPFDVFISCAQEDEAFVVQQLLPGLEAAPFSLRVCLPCRDFAGGAPVLAETDESIARSRKTLVVMSPHFLSHVWGNMELRASHRQALTEVHAKVVILVLQDVGPAESLDTELRSYLRMNTFVRWGQPFFWNHLRFLMPHRPRPARPPASRLV